MMHFEKFHAKTDAEMIPMAIMELLRQVDNNAVKALQTLEDAEFSSGTAIMPYSPATPAADSVRPDGLPYCRPDWLPTGNFANSATFQRAERSVFHLLALQASMQCPCCDFQVLKGNTHPWLAGLIMVTHLVQKHQEEYPWAVLCVAYEVERARELRL